MGKRLKDALSDWLSSSGLHKMAKRRVYRTSLKAQYYFGRRTSGRNVFMIMMPRCGSNMLLGYLNSIPGVTMAGEILNPMHFYGIRRHHIARGTALRHIDYSLNRLVGQVRGFKFAPYHLDWLRLDLDDLRTRYPQARYLVLYRRSLPDQYVSMKLAHLNNQWIARAQDVKVFTGQIELDRNDLAAFYARCRAHYESLFRHAWLKECACLVCYEDLRADPQRVFDTTLFPFLELPPAEVSTGTAKQNRASHQDLVANYDEVADLLAGPVSMQEYAL